METATATLASLVDTSDHGPVHIIQPGTTPIRAYCGVGLEGATVFPQAEVPRSSECDACVEAEARA